jgi:hypothetical protein
MGQFKDPNVIFLHGVIVKSKFCVSCVISLTIYFQQNITGAYHQLQKKSRQPLQTQHQHKQHLVDYTKIK